MFDDGRGWLELPRWHVFGLAKGVGHKYIKKVPAGTSKSGKQRYRYFYHVGHGGGVDAHDHMVEGAAFKHDGGHWKITKANGDKLTIVHDETGESKTISKSELGAMLRAKHGEAPAKKPRTPSAAIRAPVAARQARAEPRPKKEPPPSKPPGHGGNTVVFFADKGGKPEPHAAKWRVVEADSIHASHLPGSGMKVNPEYPEGVQTRVYDTDEEERNKVYAGADAFVPAFVHNTNPDSVNGAPVITEDGIAIGGNGRTMMQKHLYDTDRGHKVKDHLIAEAHQFGLDKKEIAGMKKPILVRVIDGLRADTTSRNDLKLLVQKANESFTQGMDPRADQVARALKLSDSAISSLADNLGDDETIAEFLGKPSRVGRAFVEQLEQSGAIDKRTRSQYLRSNGTLNEDGRNYVTKLFVGKLVPDPHLLSDIPSSTMTALAKAAPYILAARSRGQKYDVTPALRSALHAIVELDIHNAPDLDNYLNTPNMGLKDKDGKDVIGELDVKNDPKARQMYEILTRNKGANQLAAVFKPFARMAKFYPEGETDMFGATSTASDILHSAATRKATIEKGGIFYGPQGGKYSDAALEHSWTPDPKGGAQADFGNETDAARTVRNAKVAAALTAWKAAATDHHGKKSDRGAYQAHYDALHKLGKALGLGTGDDAVDGAKRWLRAKGYRPELHRGDTAKKAKQEAFAFKGGIFSALINAMARFAG